jgi:hypothetical protein
MSDRVTEFLSPAWLQAMADAADPVPVAPDLVIQQVVTGAEEVTWFISVCDAGVGFGTGRHPAPHITLTQDRATAAAIAAGRQSAPGAFMSGRLRVGGDVRILLEHQDELARLDDVFAPVRAMTSYPEEG